MSISIVSNDGIECKTLVSIIWVSNTRQCRRPVNHESGLGDLHRFLVFNYSWIVHIWLTDTIVFPFQELFDMHPMFRLLFLPVIFLLCHFLILLPIVLDLIRKKPSSISIFLRLSYDQNIWQMLGRIANFGRPPPWHFDFHAFWYPP